MSERKVSIHCPVCHGRGDFALLNSSKCEHCQGSGRNPEFYMNLPETPDVVGGACFAPTQGADARPVAIYQVEQAPGRWTNVSRETFDAWAFGKQIVYATRDAAPSDAPIGYVNSMWAEHRVGTTKIYPEAHPRLATFPVFAASAPRQET